VNSRGKVPRGDFAKSIHKLKPTISLVERIAAKARKGGERLLRALIEEF
jgi:hypothetical protein